VAERGFLLGQLAPGRRFRRSAFLFRVALVAHGHSWQPAVKARLHSAGDASPLTALLLAHIFPICSVVAPCHRGASPPSVLRRTFTTDCQPQRDHCITKPKVCPREGSKSSGGVDDSSCLWGNKRRE